MDPCDIKWEKEKSYYFGQIVQYNCMTWRANWYNKGREPNLNPNNAWNNFHVKCC